MTLTNQPQNLYGFLRKILKKWPQESFVFSYAGKRGQDTSSFYLSQKETQFSLEIGFRLEAHSFVITKMTLVDNTYVGVLSEALYDAALVEILLQATMLSVILCRKSECPEMAFNLLPEDAENLKVVDQVLERTASQEMRTGVCARYRVPGTPECYTFFLEESETLRMQIKHVLWCEQRYNMGVRHYLQEGIKGVPLPIPCASSSDLPTSSAPMGQVIAFPGSSSMR